MKYAIQPTSVLVKTPKGLEEIEKRTYKLAGRLRAILFMVDGQRTLGQLLDQAGNMAEQLEMQLGELAAQEFIEAIAVEVPAEIAEDDSPGNMANAGIALVASKPNVSPVAQPAQPDAEALAAVAARAILAAEPIEVSKKRIAGMLTETMGMRAMFLTAQLEGVRTRAQLEQFIDENTQTVATSNGSKVADQWRTRARKLVGL